MVEWCYFKIIKRWVWVVRKKERKKEMGMGLLLQNVEHEKKRKKKMWVFLFCWLIFFLSLSLSFISIQSLKKCKNNNATLCPFCFFWTIPRNNTTTVKAMLLKQKYVPSWVLPLLIIKLSNSLDSLRKYPQPIFHHFHLWAPINRFFVGLISFVPMRDKF